MKRTFIDAPSSVRCTYDVVLRDKSLAQCGRRRVSDNPTYCKQHLKIWLEQQQTRHTETAIMNRHTRAVATNVNVSVLSSCVDATRAARQRITVVREGLTEDGYGPDGKLLSDLDSADAYLGEVMGQLQIIIRDAK